MARNQTRNLNTLLQLAGVVETAKGPKISDDIQLTYLVGDLSGLAARLATPTFVATPSRPQVVGRRSRIELRAPPDAAIIVPWWRNEDATIHTWGVEDVTGITDDLATVAPPVELGGDSRALLQTGSGGVAEPVILPPDSETANKFPDLVVPPGQILMFATGVVNVSILITIAWLEVPILPATTPTQ